MKAGVYEMSFRGLTIRDCWRMSGPQLFLVALVLKMMGKRAGYYWLPPHEAEELCSKEELSPACLEQLQPLLDQLPGMGFDSVCFTRNSKPVDPNWCDSGEALALHKTGRRFLFLAYIHTQLNHVNSKKCTITGGFFLKNRHAVEVVNYTGGMDNSLVDKRVCIPDASLQAVVEALETEERKQLEPLKVFSGMEELRQFNREHTELAVQEQLDRHLYVKVSTKTEERLLADASAREQAKMQSVKEVGVVPPGCAVPPPVPVAADVAPVPVEPSDLFADQVYEEYRKLEHKEKKGLGKNLAVLAFTLFLFFSMGLFRSSYTDVLLLIGVILIHEMGHFIGMRLLKYNDVKMFFIPMFGAAVSGEETEPSAAKKVIVSLLGPVPGLFIGVLTGVAYFISGHPLWADATRIFFVINLFNLLPILPLDGGRVFDALIFSRHPILEVGFNAVAGLLLGYLALVSKSPLLGVVAFFVFSSIRTTHMMGSIAYHLKKEIKQSGGATPEQPPKSCFYSVVNQLKEKTDSRLRNPKTFAAFTKGVWQRVRNKPCSAGATVGFLVLYVFFFLAGLLCVSVFELAKTAPLTHVVEKTDANGNVIRVEQMKLIDHVVSEIELNEEGLYDGIQLNWAYGETNVTLEGTWKDGYQHGDWKEWDQQGQLDSVITYETGLVVRYQQRIDGELKELPKEEWPFFAEFDRYKEPQRAGSRGREVENSGF